MPVKVIILGATEITLQAVAQSIILSLEKRLNQLDLLNHPCTAIDTGVFGGFSQS